MGFQALARSRDGVWGLCHDAHGNHHLSKVGLFPS
jgi:hypothetical protein